METKETKLFEGLKQLSEKGEGTARIATLDTRDKDGDVLRAGCCGEQHVPLLVAHQWDRVPVGKVRVYEGPGAMLADFKINMALGRGKELYSALRFDLDTPPPRSEWSFGFRVPEGGAERGTFQGQPVRFLKRLEILEVSPVVAAAGIATATLSLKADSPQDQAEVVRSALATIAKGQAALLAWENEERDEGLIWWKVSTDIPGWDGLRRAALEYAVLAAKQLGVPPPRVFFYRRAATPEQRDFRTAGEMIGVSNWAMRPGEIGVYEGVSSDRALVETVGHETFHYAHPGADEKAAEEFGKRFGAKMFADAPSRRSSLGALVAAACVARGDRIPVFAAYEPATRAYAGGPRAGRPSPGMTYDEKGVPSFGREDETRVIVSYQPIS